MVAALERLVAWILESVQFKGRADSSKCDFNRLHLDASAIGKFAISNLLSENSQGGKLFFCGLVGEEWVHVICFTFLDPMIPKAFCLVVVCRHDAMVHCSDNSKAIILETVAAFRRKRRQD